MMMSLSVVAMLLVMLTPGVMSQDDSGILALQASVEEQAAVVQSVANNQDALLQVTQDILSRQTDLRLTVAAIRTDQQQFLARNVSGTVQVIAETIQRIDECYRQRDPFCDLSLGLQ